MNKILFFYLILFSINASAQLEDFTLPSATDSSEFKLSENKGKYIVMHFLLKTECPYCTKHTNEYIQRAEEIPNTAQVFIKPDKESRIKEWSMKIPGVEKHKVYHDSGAALAKKLKIPNGYEFHGQTVHYPATIILNKEGIELYRYVGEDNTDRLSFDITARKIKRFQKLGK